MSEIFAHVPNEENVDKYASAGMDVYLNVGKGNVGILGNHIFPNQKFAMRGTDERLQKYLSRGVISLLAAGYGTVDSAPAAEEQKTKKKKAVEPEVSAAEIHDSAEPNTPNEETAAMPVDAAIVEDVVNLVEEESSNI